MIAISQTLTALRLRRLSSSPIVSTAFVGTALRSRSSSQTTTFVSSRSSSLVGAEVVERLVELRPHRTLHISPDSSFAWYGGCADQHCDRLAPVTNRHRLSRLDLAEQPRELGLRLLNRYFHVRKGYYEAG